MESTPRGFRRTSDSMHSWVTVMPVIRGQAAKLRDTSNYSNAVVAWNASIRWLCMEARRCWCERGLTLPLAAPWLFLLSHVLLQRESELLPGVRHGAASARAAGHRHLPAVLLPHRHQTWGGALITSRFGLTVCQADNAVKYRDWRWFWLLIFWTVFADQSIRSTVVFNPIEQSLMLEEEEDSELKGPVVGRMIVVAALTQRVTL